MDCLVKISVKPVGYIISHLQYCAIPHCLIEKTIFPPIEEFEQFSTTGSTKSLGDNIMTPTSSKIPQRRNSNERELLIMPN